MDQPLNYDTIADAGLTQSEFAELCGVSRVTVNLWIKGKMNPHRFVRDRVAEVLDQIREAHTKGSLPVAKSRGAARKKLIEAALGVTMN